MDGGAWGAAAHGVSKSRTRLSDFPFTFHCHALEKAMEPAPVLSPGESQGRGSLGGCRLRGRTESDRTEAPSQQQEVGKTTATAQRAATVGTKPSPGHVKVTAEPNESPGSSSWENIGMPPEKRESCEHHPRQQHHWACIGAPSPRSLGEIALSLRVYIQWNCHS